MKSRRLSRPSWLVTHRDDLPVCRQPGKPTNRAWRRVTMTIEHNVLSTKPILC